MRDKIKKLIEELQKPGTNKDELVREIIKLKEALGDAVPTYDGTKPKKSSSSRKSKKSTNG